MKNRMLIVLLVVLLAVTPLLGACQQSALKPEQPEKAETPEKPAEPEKPQKEKVELTMGSWRADDVAQMNNLIAAYKAVAPDVNITFQPTNPPDYNATLRLQLDSDTGPDLMYARSYATGQELFNAGFFADCTDIPGLTDNFTASNLAPWQMPDGKMFAVPFAAVSHAVYYNKDIFAAQGLSVPATWDEFIEVCQTLKDNGITPLANGVADEWDILECFFLGMLPNYVGGADQRVLYEKGDKKLNDENFVNAYTDIAEVAPFLPDG
ncbi:MAG TPA: ABC transporter substrate-binding protein, partial [Clostridia bacterium]|nr:ABC transporter substrate-binding protein [Clostridia bacterium]